MDPLRKRLGQTIKAVRKEKRISQVQVGDSGNLSRLEKGTQWISEERLVEIAERLGVPAWMLFARADGALQGGLWDLLTVYNTADDEGRELIDIAVRTAKRYHVKPPPLRPVAASAEAEKREPRHTRLGRVKRHHSG